MRVRIQPSSAMLLPAVWLLTPHDVARLDVSVDKVMLPQVLQTFS